MKNNKVVAVKVIEQDMLDPENGIVSCEFVLFEDMDDDVLEVIYETDPELIATKRPDFVKRRYPSAIN